MNAVPKQDPPGAVTTLVCGILSIVLAWLPLAGLALGIVSLVTARKARAVAVQDPDTYKEGGLRTGGLVCGIVGTSLSGVYSLFWILMAIIGLAAGAHAIHH